jgi:hypothetical protein
MLRDGCDWCKHGVGGAGCFTKTLLFLCRFAHTIDRLDHCISHFFSFGLSATAAAAAAVVVAVVVAMTGFAPFCGRSDSVRKVKSVAVVGERVIIIEQRD